MELNLWSSPSIAESIFQLGSWTFYKKPSIAALCEQKGLYLRALENYTDIKDIKWIVLNHGNTIPPEFLKNYLLHTLAPDFVAPVLTEVLWYSKNIALGVEVATGVVSRVGVKDLVEVFEVIGAYEGVVWFLEPLLTKTKDS